MTRADESTPGEPASLDQLLDQLARVARQETTVSLRAIVLRLGDRSFGPLLLLAGLVTLAPLIGDIPGVPTLMAAVVLVVAAQLTIGREHIWLPRWLLARSAPADKVERAVAWLRRPARSVDRLLRPRLTPLTGRAGRRAIAIACIAIAALMPPMEFIPFSANGAGIALCAFGLAIIAHDGVVATVAFTATLATFAAVVYALA